MTISQVSVRRGWRGVGLMGWLAVSALGQASQPVVKDQLGKPGKVAGETEKRVSGGTTVGTGWKATSASSQIRITLAKPLGPKDKGAVELDITNWDPKNQYKTDKQQFFALISRADGDPSDGNLWEKSTAKHCYALIRGGTNYIGYGGRGKGVGFKSFVQSSDGHRTETPHFIDRNDWSKEVTYTLRFEVDESKVRMYLNGMKFREQSFKDRQEDLGYVFIGKDNWKGTASALIGPVFEELRVYGASGGTVSVHRPSEWILAARRPPAATAAGYDLAGRLMNASSHRSPPSLQLFAFPGDR